MTGRPEEAARIEGIRAELKLPVQSQFIREDVRFLLDVIEVQGRVIEAAQRAAKNARAIAAAPDYDEEAIRAALWAVVAAACPADPKEPGR